MSADCRSSLFRQNWALFSLSMKPLYVAKSLSDLEDMCVSHFSKKSHGITVDSVLRLFEEASKLRCFDEERAFMLYGGGLSLFADIENKGDSSISCEVCCPVFCMIAAEIPT